MAITRYAGNRFDGLEADVKPVNVPDGAKWTDLDGLKRTYIFISGVWEEYIGGAIDPANSIEINGDNLQLVGDVVSPGNNKTYGTDGAGLRVWKDDSPGGGGIDAITTESAGANTTITTTNSALHALTMTANLTATISDFNEAAKTHRFVLKVIQDATGGWTLTIAGNVLFPAGIQPSNSESTGAVDLYEFVWDGTNWLLDNYTAAQA